MLLLLFGRKKFSNGNLIELKTANYGKFSKISLTRKETYNIQLNNKRNENFPS